MRVGVVDHGVEELGVVRRRQVHEAGQCTQAHGAREPASHPADQHLVDSESFHERVHEPAIVAGDHEAIVAIASWKSGSSAHPRRGLIGSIPRLIISPMAAR
jgi:hypothetical protein